MTSFDDEIRAALSAEEQRLYDELDSDLSLNEMMIGPFRTRMRWWSAYAFVLSFLFFLVAVWCGYRFFIAPDAADRVFWGIWMLLAAFSVSMLKLWFFMEMNKFALVREIRRVELQLAGLASRLGAG